MPTSNHTNIGHKHISLVATYLTQPVPPFFFSASSVTFSVGCHRYTPTQASLSCSIGVIEVIDSLAIAADTSREILRVSPMDNSAKAIDLAMSYDSASGEHEAKLGFALKCGDIAMCYNANTAATVFSSCFPSPGNPTYPPRWGIVAPIAQWF